MADQQAQLSSFFVRLQIQTMLQYYLRQQQEHYILLLHQLILTIVKHSALFLAELVDILPRPHCGPRSVRNGWIVCRRNNLGSVNSGSRERILHNVTLLTVIIHVCKVLILHRIKPSFLGSVDSLPRKSVFIQRGLLCENKKAYIYFYYILS